MGVYIDMEMPTRCGRCDMRIPVYDDGIFDHYECCITAAIIDNLGEKMEDCPIVPVPPHGDLIDRDALIMERGIDTYAAVFTIATAPTIIPASGG